MCYFINRDGTLSSGDSREASMDTITGNCLCGAITFEMANQFANFHLCHCVQCQKSTGSAHASNLFTRPDNITWHTGEELVARYDVPGRRISNVFCQACGSRIPYLSLSGEVLVVPAGTLDGQPEISPSANIFWTERPGWYDDAIEAPHFSEYAE